MKLTEALATISYTTMTEYRYVLMDVSVTKPKVNQHGQAAASLLAVELKKVREREKKLQAALYEVFPLDLYAHKRGQM